MGEQVNNNDDANRRSDVRLSGDILVGNDIRWNPGFTSIDISGTVRPDTADSSILFAGLATIPASTATFDTTAGRTLTLLDDIGPGSLTLHTGGGIIGDGTLRADVTADNASFIAPGHSAGVLTIDGNVAMKSGSTLQIELEDNAQPAGAGFDQLVITDTFTAGGDLDLIVLAAFAPSMGDTFDIVSASAILGSFDRVLGSGIDSELGLSVTYLADTIRLEAGLIGDLTGDGFVGDEDLNLILANWGQEASAGNWLSGDADGSGRVGVGDLTAVLDHWSNGTPPSPQVPEPASVVLLGLGVFSFTRRRRSRVNHCVFTA